jgi:hypothetical protein
MNDNKCKDGCLTVKHYDGEWHCMTCWREFEPKVPRRTPGHFYLRGCDCDQCQAVHRSITNTGHGTG